MKKISFFFIIYFLFSLNTLFAQDIHFSQYYNSPLRMNPALCGIFNQDARLIGNSKLQWQSVPVGYKTFSVSYDQKVFSKNRTTGFYAFGVNADYDWSGYSNLSNTNLILTGAYTQKLGDLSLISIGFQTGVIYRDFSYNKLTFDHQYNGNVFDPKIGIDETFESRSAIALDLSTGINYRYQLSDKRTKFDVGAGFFHPHKPNVAFSKNDFVALKPRISGYLLSTVKASKNIDGIVNLFGQNQGHYNEVYAGGGIRYYFSQKKYHESSMFIGAHYRFSEVQDAIIPMVDFEVKNWRVGFSYDYTISGFSVANNHRGGPEVSVQYFINNVKSIKASKNCPIF